MNRPAKQTTRPRLRNGKRLQELRAWGARLIREVVPPRSQQSSLLDPATISRWRNPEYPNPLTQLAEVFDALACAGCPRSRADLLLAALADRADECWPGSGPNPSQLQRDVGEKFREFRDFLAQVAEERELR